MSPENVEYVTGETAANVVGGHASGEKDPLPPDHRLSEAGAKALRAESRKISTPSGGIANGVSEERTDLYDNLSDMAGESGAQGGMTGREDQNPIGRHK